MRASVTAVALLLSATVFAQETADATPKPDYSRDTLMRLLVEQPARERQPAVRFRVGAVEFNALGTEWRFVYLPIMMPFSGSSFGTTQTLPDPFSLTGTPIATSPRVIRQHRRAIERELRRIGKMKVDVQVKGGAGD